MKSLLFLLVLMFTFPSQAEVSKIYEIWEPENTQDNYLVLTTNGRVHEVERHRQDLIQSLAKAQSRSDRLHFIFNSYKNNDQDQRKFIQSFTLASDNEKALESNQNFVPESLELADPMGGYSPTVVSSMRQASQYFYSMRTRSRSRSECYNRAYVWNYELWRRFKINSSKIFMFFTKKYIRQYRYHWWFHVTPAIEVAGQPELIAMDRRYMRGPTSLTNWKNYFIRNNAYCPMIKSYRYYRNNQYSEYCYHIQASMYFWQPLHLENLERRGWNPSREFKYSELRVAYGNGFGLRVPRGNGQDVRTTPTRRRRRRWWNPRRWF